MNLGLFRREHLASGDTKMVGDAVVDQFQRTHGALTAWMEVEHTDDGHHTDIHADSITVDGDVVVGGGVETGDGGFTGEGGEVAIGDLPNTSVPGQPPQSGGYGIKIGPWRIISDALNSPGTPSLPSLAFQFINEAFGTYLFRFMRAAAYDWALTPFAGVLLRLGRPFPGERIASVDTTTLGVGQNATVGGNLVVQGDVTVNAIASATWMRAGPSAGYYEFGRSTAQGERNAWAPLVLTSSGINCGGSISAYFSLVGYQLWWSISAISFTVPAGSFPYLAITLPPGYATVTNYTDQPLVRGYVPGIGDEPCWTQTNTTHILVYRMKSVAWPTGAGHLIGQGFYWIG